MAIGRITGQMLSANLARSGTDLAFETNLLVLDVTNSRVGVGTASPATTFHVSATDALRLPSGNSAQRPGSPANGDIRYNSDTGAVEGYAGGWLKMTGGTSLADADGDTQIQVERTADEDAMHFEVGGTDAAHIRANGNIELNNLQIADTTISTLSTNGDLTLTPNGTGKVIVTDGTTLQTNTADINGGAIDGTVIGANSAAAGTFTTINTSGNATISGNLTVNGTTTTISTTNTTIADNIIELNSGISASSNDSGLIIERGSTGDNAFIGWDESADKFTVGTTTATAGDKSGGISVTTGTLVANLEGDVTGTVSDISNHLLDEDNMASNDATKAPSQQSVKAYVDAEDANIASDTLTFTNKTFDANGTGNTLSNVEVADLAADAVVTVAETLASNDSDSMLVTAGAIIDYVDAQDANIASDTLTFTNKTFDANGTGNSLSNVEVADFASGVLDTDLSSVSGSDDTLASAKAIKAYVDSTSGAQAITFVGDDSTGTAVNTGETFQIAGGTGITSAVSGDTMTMAIDSTVTTLTGTQTLTNKTLTTPTLTSPVLNTGVSGTAILDEDNMATNSDTQLATQQSIKAYVDAEDANIASDTLTFTNKTIDANGTGNSITNIDSGNFLSGFFLDEDNMASNDATAVASQQSIKAYVDAEDANIASDTLTFTNKTFDANGTGNSLSNVDIADFTSGVFLDEDNMASNSATAIASQQSIKAYVDTEIGNVSTTSISQGNSSATISDTGSDGAFTVVADGNTELVINDTSATFSGNVIMSGNLTVNGTTTTVNTTNTTVSDNILELNSGTSSSGNDAGIIIERGSTGDNAFIGWDESADKFTVGTTTATADDKSGGISVTTGTLVANLEGDVTGDVTGTVSDISNHLLDEDNMATDSATKAPSQQSVKAYVDAQDANIASDTLTFTNKTFDANGTGNSLSNVEVADLAAGAVVLEGEGIGSNDNDTTLPTSAAVKDFVDTETANVASDSMTLTNKTFDANGTGNSISNIDFADFTSGVVLDEDNMASDSATNLATQQSIKAYVDSQVTGADLDFTADDSTTNSIDLDSEVLQFSGDTGINTSATGNTVSIAIDSTVATLTGSQTLTNKTLTTPVIASISNTGTLTLPTSSDTLVGRATTDTFTNKTLDADGTGNSITNIDAGNLKSGFLLDEDNMASDSATAVASQQSIKAYVDAEDANIASDTLTLTNKTFDANGTGNSLSNVEVADFAGSAIINVSETLASNDSDTALVTAGAIIDYVDAQDANIASDTLTFTNKTFDANGTGNSLSNVQVADFASGEVLDEDNMASDSATKLATQQSIKAYVDTEIGNVSTSSIAAGDTSVAITDTGSDGTVTITADGNTEVTINDTSATFNGNVIVSGDFTVNGTTTTIDSTTLTVEDPLIQLAKNNSGGAANAFDQGLFFNRGSLDNVSFMWDESEDQFAFAVTSGEDGTTAGNITIDSYAALKAGVTTVSDLETGVISAADGTESATIANSTGVMTIASSVLTTADINGGTVDGVTIGGASAGAGTFTNLTVNTDVDITDSGGDGTMDGVIIGGSTAAAGTFTTIGGTTATLTNAQVTNIKANDGTAAIAIADSTGAVTISTAVELDGGNVTINESSASVDFRVESNGHAHALFVDGSEDHVGIKTATPAYDLDISGSTDAINLPQGNTSARPTAAAGIIRFNTQTGQYEGSQDGSTYVNFAIAGDVPTFTKESTTGDGSTSTFSGFFSSAPESANNVFVYIDNVYQEPTENYTVSGTNITFTSAPHSGARIFAITGADNTALATGGVARSESAAVSVSGSSATNIMTFNAASYRSAELFITVQDSGNTQYSAMKATVIHDGTTAYGSTYAVTNSAAGDIVDISFNHDGSSTVEVKATPLNSGTQSIKVQYSLSAV